MWFRGIKCLRPAEKSRNSAFFLKHTCRNAAESVKFVGYATVQDGPLTALFPPGTLPTLLHRLIMSELTDKIEAAIHKIRPFLEADGGDIELVEVTPDHIARVRLLGACSQCSMSLMTLKAGVEETIRREVPEIRSVEAVNAELV